MSACEEVRRKGVRGVSYSGGTIEMYSHAETEKSVRMRMHIHSVGK